MNCRFLSSSKLVQEELNQASSRNVSGWLLLWVIFCCAVQQLAILEMPVLELLIEIICVKVNGISCGIEIATNYLAEVMPVLVAIELAGSLGCDRIIVQSDSKAVVCDYKMDQSCQSLGGGSVCSLLSVGKFFIRFFWRAWCSACCW